MLSTERIRAGAEAPGGQKTIGRIEGEEPGRRYQEVLMRFSCHSPTLHMLSTERNRSCAEAPGGQTKQSSFIVIATCIPHTNAILLHGYCTIHDPPPPPPATPLLYPIHHTISVMAISCIWRRQDLQLWPRALKGQSDI